MCIPHEIEKEVIKRAIDTKKKEGSVIMRILNEENAINIYEEEGEF